MGCDVIALLFEESRGLRFFFFCPLGFLDSLMEEAGFLATLNL